MKQLTFPFQLGPADTLYFEGQTITMPPDAKVKEFADADALRQFIESKKVANTGEG